MTSPSVQLTLGPTGSAVDPHPALAGFHPAVAEWFRRRFPEGPTAPQAEGWPHIAAGHDTLIAAPTGSGKTLAGFLVVHRPPLPRPRARASRSTGVARVVYVSPLKALAVDIAENLERPLAEIADGRGRARARRARPHGSRSAPATPPARERAAMVRTPPSFVVTTPESLYLLVTSDEGPRRAAHRRDRDRRRDPRGRARQARRAPRAHARAARGAVRARARTASGCRRRSGRSRRSARLLVGDRPLPADRRRRPPARPRPRARAARGRARGGHVGRADGRRARPHRRARAASTAPRSCSSTPAGSPSGSRTSSASGSATTSSPRTTAACRRTAGTGSRRRLRAGELQGAGRHRVARARHRHRPGRARVPDRLAAQHRHLPAARRPLEPQPRRHAEGPALPADARRARRVRRAARRGARRPARRHPAPARCRSTSLAQQIVAEIGAQEWRTDDLFELVRRGRARTATSPAQQFDEVVDLVSDGIETGRGPRGAYVHHDAVNGELRGRKGARLAALTSRRRHPRDRRLPRRRRARRHVHRHRQRGLGRRVDGGRHLPARHALVADPPGRAGRGAGARRRRRAADHPVLDGRGAGPHRRAVGRGVRAARRRRRVPRRRRSRRRAAVARRGRRRRAPTRPR